MEVPLDKQEPAFQQIPAIEKSVGLLIILYAVYAFDAPIPVIKLKSGYLYKGVKKYLENIDF